jgi:hypothetical protein
MFCCDTVFILLIFNTLKHKNKVINNCAKFWQKNNFTTDFNTKMIHPKTELKLVNPTVGYGVFATDFIPKGTIVYVKDTLEIEISPADFLTHSLEMQEVIEKYSYKDEKGYRIISWDFAKYVNHCCNCNTISTGYGFEMAIRDIQKGEQITDEYGIFNLDYEMVLSCSFEHCRKVIRPKDFDNYYADWDAKIQSAMRYLFEVEQPLMNILNKEILGELAVLKENSNSYKSVYNLRFKKNA